MGNREARRLGASQEGKLRGTGEGEWARGSSPTLKRFARHKIAGPAWGAVPRALLARAADTTGLFTETRSGPSLLLRCGSAAARSAPPGDSVRSSRNLLVRRVPLFVVGLICRISTDEVTKRPLAGSFSRVTISDAFFSQYTKRPGHEEGDPRQELADLLVVQNAQEKAREQHEGAYYEPDRRWDVEGHAGRELLVELVHCPRSCPRAAHARVLEVVVGVDGVARVEVHEARSHLLVLALAGNDLVGEVGVVHHDPEALVEGGSVAAVDPLAAHRARRGGVAGRGYRGLRRPQPAGTHAARALA